MGAKGRASRDRRAQLAGTRKALLAGLERMEADPQARADLEAAVDAGVRDRASADKVAQIGRLRIAGWRPASATEPNGVGIWDQPRRGLRLIHAVRREEDDQIWAHVSVSHARMAGLPDWYEVRDAQWMLYPRHAGIVVIAPKDEHVNVSEVAHVWTCLTEKMLPDFRRLGAI